MSAASSPASSWPSCSGRGSTPTHTRATADIPSGAGTPPVRLARVLPNATVIHAEEMVGHRDGSLSMTLLDVVPQPAQPPPPLAHTDKPTASTESDHRYAVQPL